jgi:hypothetical protein
VEGCAQPRGAPGDAPAAPAPRAVPDEGQEAVVGADEAPAVGLHDDGVARAADAGVDDRQEDRSARVLQREMKKKMRRGLDAEIRHVVQGIDDRDARPAGGEDRLDLSDVQVARAEIREEDDQAALAASSFFAGFFLPAFSSGALSAVVISTRSIRLTSASGALSPLRKPVLRMRR